MGSLVVLLQFWKPKGAERAKAHGTLDRRSFARLVALRAVSVFVLLWGLDALPVKAWVNRATITFAWPGLHNLVTRMPPVTAKPSPYAATFAFNWLAASGTSCLLAVFASAMVLRVSPRRLAVMTADTARQLLLPMVTISSVLALAFLMNYSGETATLGLAFSATGAMFPFFSALLGWLGVFLTGSDTSANALFGNLQVVTANHLGLNPGADGRREFERRRDGKNDQPAKHLRRRRRHRHGAKRRSEIVPLHAAPQHFARRRDRTGRGVLRVYHAGLGQMTAQRREIPPAFSRRFLHQRANRIGDDLDPFAGFQQSEGREFDADFRHHAVDDIAVRREMIQQSAEINVR